MSEERKESGVLDREERRVLFHPVILLTIGIFLIAPFAYYVVKSKRSMPSPPVLGDLPDFKLIDQDGREFSKKNLLGKVTVVCFFFSRCETVCPPLMAAMRRFQTMLEEAKLDAQMVSISVDPDYDTPERLKKFAKKLGADLKRWHFLTGKIEEIRQLGQKGFRVVVGNPRYEGNLMEITHSSKLILVDQRGRIRARIDSKGRPLGYFDTSPDGLKALLLHVQRVLWEQYSE